jgi:hypothetical protein
MSATYTIEVNTHFDPREVLDKVFHNLKASFVKKEGEDFIRIEGEGFRGRTRQINTVADALSEGLDISANFSIRVDLASATQDSEDIGYINILKAAKNWLDATSEDMVLLVNGERVLVMRKSGIIIRNSDKTLWTDEGLKLIPTPHEIKYIPVL